MKNTENTEDNLYIDVTRFKKAKEIHEKNGDKKKFTYSKIASVLDLHISTVQKYCADTEKQIPIRRVYLEKLAQYMDVSPNWLCGIDDYLDTALGGPGYYTDIVPYEIGLSTYDQRRLLADYLECVRIKNPENNYDESDKSADYFTKISDVPVSYEQFSSYLDEIESAIEYITGRFIKHIKE